MAKACFLSGLFRLVDRCFGALLRRETLRTGGKILSDVADNTSTGAKHRHIIAKHVNDSAQNLIQKLRGKGRKRAATLKAREIPPKKNLKQRAEDYKERHLYIGLIISYQTMAADVVSAAPSSTYLLLCLYRL